MLEHLTPLLSSPWLYAVVFVLVALDGFLPVVPSEAVVIGLGALTATGPPDLLLLATAVVAGGLAGDRVTYELGRRARGRLASRPGRGSRLRGRLADAATRLGRHGGAAILLGRFVPYGRTASGLSAGSVRMPLRHFTLFTALSSTAWAAYVLAIGRLGGATFAGNPLLGALAGMALGMLLAGVWALVERVRTRREPPTPEPRETVLAADAACHRGARSFPA